MGLHVDERPRTPPASGLDDRECQFLLQRGTAEDVTALGWQVDDHETFDVILERVTSRGLPVREGSAGRVRPARVERLWRFPGPKGAATEIFTTPADDAQPLVMRNAAFVTGESGMGHVAITSKDVLGLHSYYSTLFDARLSDFILERIGPMDLRIRFLRVNERHHSVAVAGVRRFVVDPIRTVIQHVNVQVAELDDMVAAHERGHRRGIQDDVVGRPAPQRPVDLLLLPDPVGASSSRSAGAPGRDRGARESTGEPTTYQGSPCGAHPCRRGHHPQDGHGPAGVAVRAVRRGTVPELRDPASVPA